MSAPNSSHDLLPRIAAFFRERRQPAFLVGGFLRDRLLGRPSHDLDLAIHGNPSECGHDLAQFLGGTPVPISARWVCRIVLPAGADGQGQLDLAGFPGDIYGDLQGRDFTINAMALPLELWDADHWDEQIIDPVAGRTDLSRKIVRATDDSVFDADPGRLMRAVRLATALDFRLDPETAQSIRRHASLVHRVSPERVRDELLAIFAGDRSRVALEVLDRLDLLCRIIPELAVTKGVGQPRVHYWDVWGHSIHAVETAELVTRGHQNSPIYSMVPWTPETEAHFGEIVSDGHTRRTILKLTALLHDIAKPQTKTVDAAGRTRFLGHSERGARICEDRLGQLRLSSRGIAMVSKMVEQHLRPASMNQDSELPSRRAVYRYFRDLGEVALDTVYLAMADYLAAKGPEVSYDDWARHAKIMAHIMQTGAEELSPQRPARIITGHDLMREMGLSQGPLIGELIERINEAHAAGEVASPQEALELAAALVNGRNGHSGDQE